ncbi:MAG TPA: secretin and TonB N-terminal domain-containing protein [Gemmatimonadaceae bacterium]|nr:secretin and TonB N-terminal domain-containing protein [Gemmatimonadaceae bacterium]
MQTTVRTEPAAVAPQSIAPGDDGAVLPLTNRPVAPSALADAPTKRVSINAPPGSDVADVARQIGKTFGLNVAVDPDVHGKVVANLRDVTLDEALQDVVRKNGFSYQLQGRTLRVTPVRLSTRIFTLDYVALSRVGTANTVIQRRLSGSASGGAVAGLAGLGSPGSSAGYGGVPGGDVIAATQVSDLWMELRIALMGLLSRDTGPAAASGPGGANGINAQASPQQGGGLASSAFATTWPDGSALTLSPASGLITVTATDDKLADVQTYIESFESSVLRQVLIEAKIVEVQLTKELQYGIDWSVVTKAGNNKTVGLVDNSGGTLPTGTASTTGQTGKVSFSLAGGATQVNAVLTALATQGDVTVLSDARTSALNNQRAVFDVTTDEVFFADIRQPLIGPNGGVIQLSDQIQAQTIAVGIVLDVLPQISSQNVLTMNIRPVVTSLDRVETFTGADGTSARFPVVSRREGDTMARVRNGETIVIGGLMQNQRTRNVSGVPILKDIPLLGKLFTHVDDVDKRVELVVFLTPTVITGQPGVGR